MKYIILLIVAMSCLILLTSIMPASATDIIHFDNNGSGYHPDRGDRRCKPVPEPGTLLLLGSGLLISAVFFALRRK